MFWHPAFLKYPELCVQYRFELFLLYMDPCLSLNAVQFAGLTLQFTSALGFNLQLEQSDFLRRQHFSKCQVSSHSSTCLRKLCHLFWTWKSDFVALRRLGLAASISVICHFLTYLPQNINFLTFCWLECSKNRNGERTNGSKANSNLKTLKKYGIL